MMINIHKNITVRNIFNTAVKPLYTVVLNICLEEFGPTKVFDQSTKIHKTEHLVTV